MMDYDWQIMTAADIVHSKDLFTYFLIYLLIVQLQTTHLGGLYMQNIEKML